MSTTGTPPVVLASNQTHPSTVAIDDQNVYWVNEGALGGVYKIPKAGGTPTPLFEGAMGPVESLGLDSASVYFPIVTEPRIAAVPTAGGPIRTVASSGPTRGVAVSNGHVFWIEPTQDALSPSVAKKVQATGGTTTMIDMPSNPRMRGAYFAVPGTDAIYAGIMAGGLVRIPLGGNKATSLAVGETGGVAVDGDHVYFATSDGIDVMPKTGGCPRHIATAEHPVGVAVDEAYVYFIDNGTKGRVLKVGKDGGALTILADNEGGAHAIAVDVTSVYWNNIPEGTIKKVAK